MTHETIEQLAALVLGLGGLAFVVMSIRRARLSSPGSIRVGLDAHPADATVSQLVWLAVGSASLGAAIIHFALAPEHLEELGALGAGFVLAGLLQAASTLAAVVARTRIAALALIVLNVVLIAVWVWSRVFGLPAGHEPWTPEAVGRPDTVAVVFEAMIVILLTLWMAIPRALDADVGSMFASFGLVPAVGVVAVLTILALSGGEGGHVHGAVLVPIVVSRLTRGP